MSRGVPMTPDLCEALAEWVGDGGTIREWCRQDGNPSYRTVYRLIESDKAFAALMEAERASGYEALAEDILAIADAKPNHLPNGGVDAGDVAHRKHRTWARLELLKKWHPKRYGDKQAVEHSGGVQITLDTGIRREVNPSPAADDAT